MTKEQLGQYPYLKARVRRLPGEIERLKGDWAVCGAVLASQKSEPFHLREIIVGDRETTKEAQFRIIEKQSELEAAICDMRDIENYIDSMVDVRLKEIMTFRYIYGETWDEVARHFGYRETADSCRMVIRRHFDNAS